MLQHVHAEGVVLQFRRLDSTPLVSDPGTARLDRFEVFASDGGVWTYRHRGYGAAGTTVYPTGIASAEAFGTPIFTSTGPVLLPAGIASAEAFGVPTFSWRTTITTTGIASGERFGTPVLTRDGVAALIRRSSMLAIRIGINL